MIGRQPLDRNLLDLPFERYDIARHPYVNAEFKKGLSHPVIVGKLRDRLDVDAVLPEKSVTLKR